MRMRSRDSRGGDSCMRDTTRTGVEDVAADKAVRGGGIIASEGEGC